MIKQVRAGVLKIAYLEAGPAGGAAVILLHGFPYDVNSFAEVLDHLVSAGCRVFIPYLRGFGPTRFLSETTCRSGQQAALAADLCSFMDGVEVKRAVLAGYDWGGRAACIIAALNPARVRGLVTCGGYNIQNISKSLQPQEPEAEFRYWYQYYFHGERGRLGLQQNRYELCRLLWRLWSPHWQFDQKTFDLTKDSFDNPDFVEVVIHSYRHRYGLVKGDPAYEGTEQALSVEPLISVPSIAMFGQSDGLSPAYLPEFHDHFFASSYECRTLPSVGHNIPQEAPADFADAVVSLLSKTN